ncbi:MAG: hypothetical protein ACFFC7_07535 [Candidatus Hermodarchaeota archaeon]
MLRYFWMLISVRGRIFLSLLLLVSLPLACLGHLFLYEDVDQPFEQIELAGGSEQEEIRPDIADALQNLGQHFKENKGQLDNPEVQYYYSQMDFGVAFTDTGVIYRLSGEPSVIVTVSFIIIIGKQS